MRIVSMTLVATLAAGAGYAQFGGGLGGGTGMGRGGTVGPNTTPMGDPYPGGQRGIFISGKVALSDGAALPEPVKIERRCGVATRVAAYTDLKGRFSFDMGQTAEVPDVSQDPAGIGPGGRSRNRTVLDCELRFTLPGFRTETVSLADERYLDNPDLGTVILRRIANVDGLTVSATSALAPKDAKKAYDKGMEALSKKNAAEAQKDFEKAAELYPRYAAAWFELGQLSEQKNQFDDARKSYGQAVQADAKYIPPHERLAWIALRDSKWQEMGDESGAVLRLDPIDYPDAYYLNGVANFQLGNLDAAEKSVREALERDTAHKNARTPYLLGLILAQKRQYSAAVPYLRAFLDKNSDASDAATIRQQLASIEQAAEQAAAGTSGAGGAPSPAKASQEGSSPEKPAGGQPLREGP